MTFFNNRASSGSHCGRHLTSLRRYGGLTLTAFAMLLLGSCDKDSFNNEPTPGEENYLGPASEVILGPEATGFNSSSFTLALEAPDGSTILREGQHRRINSRSHLNLKSGLADGIYRLLYLEYPITDNPELKDLADQFSTTQFGLGSRIEVNKGIITVLDHYDEAIGLPGRGTEEEPYEISSYNSLIKLAQLVNSEDNNILITSDTHFRQTGKIDMYQASREIDRRYGWQPIGANPALPFRGHYHGAGISTLIIDRPNSAGVGLFGYVNDAAFYDVRLSNSSVTGNFGAGGIAGATLQSGQSRGLVTMLGCSVSGSEIRGGDQSIGVGALLGVIDTQSRAFINSCSSDGNSVSSTYNAGGLVGASGLYSSVSFSSCGNTSEVTSDYSGAGGLIGTCDTIQAATSWNSGRIAGAAVYNGTDKSNSGIGAGGIAGGIGAATITSCHNTGTVSGYSGVGGLVGSGRVKGSDTEAYMYNNAMLRYCWNEGDINGTEGVGGLVGEAQTGTYAVYNKGNVSGKSYVAGIAGCTSIAVTHNAINLGNVSGTDYVSGIVGKTQFGSLALNHNYGSVNGSGKCLGGIVGLAGNNTMINYCGNFGTLTSTANTAVGGIVGEIGDPRVWTAMNYAECVIGSLEIAMGFLGPFMAFTSKSLEAISHTLEIVLHVSETLTDSGLLVYDAVSWGMGLGQMIDDAAQAKISTELSQEVNTVNNEVKRTMATFRSRQVSLPESFDLSCYSSGYNAFINDNLSYYEAEGGDDKFNERINLKREEREEGLEKTHKRDEIIHQCVGGVCIFVGAVGTIGGLVLSGGAALPFVLAAGAASVAGGLNALTKTCMEFEENVVIISQCVNGGNVTAPKGADLGGLVGRLHDNCILRDCLNTGNGPGYGCPFAANLGDNALQQRVVSLAKYDTWDSYSAVNKDKSKDCAMWAPDASDDAVNGAKSHFTRLLRTYEEVNDPSTYKSISKSWSIGDTNSLWKIGSSSATSFPVPAWSEMTQD